MRRLVVGVILILGTVIFLACAPAVPLPAPQAPAPAPAAAPTPAGPAVAPARPAWQEEWEKTLTAAKKEGKLLVYGTAGAMTDRSLSSTFKERYGISVEKVIVPAGQSLQRLKRERSAQIYEVDIYFSTAPDKVEAKSAGILAPFDSFLVLPEVVDPGAWVDSKLPWVDINHTILAFCLSPASTWVVNTEMVKPEEVRSFKDLLSPKWKGEMTMFDPAIPGAGNTWFFGAGEYLMGYDYLRQLAKQELTFSRDYRQQAEWVARGKYPITIAPQFAAIAEFQQLGSPISWVIPLEGNTLIAGGSTLSLIDRAPHPNAAKVFMNWLLTKEGLAIWSKAQNAQTARVDVPADFLDPAMVRQPGTKYVSQESEEIYQKRFDNLNVAKEMFGR